MRKVSIRSTHRGICTDPGEKALLRRAVRRALELEGMQDCAVYVSITDDAGIRQINREQRKMDSATDVLSFPMLEFVPGEAATFGPEELDPETGLLFLGDIVISLERAKDQAREYGHSVARELAFLAVHSVLHLLGYDHPEGTPMKAAMRAREEAILADLGLTRSKSRGIDG